MRIGTIRVRNPKGKYHRTGMRRAHGNSKQGALVMQENQKGKVAFIQMVPVGGDSITSIRAVIDALLAS